MLTFFLKTDNLIINNWLPSLSKAKHVVQQDHPHHLTKYEGKPCCKWTKTLIFKLFSELGKIWKCSLGFSKIPISISFMNWRRNFESMDELGKFMFL